MQSTQHLFMKCSFQVHKNLNEMETEGGGESLAMLRVRAIKCFYWDWMLCRVRVRASNKIKQIKIQIAIRTLPRSIRLSPLAFKWSWLASKPQKGENSARVLSRNWIRLRNESRRRGALFITLAEHSFGANVHDVVQMFQIDERILFVGEKLFCSAGSLMVWKAFTCSEQFQIWF